MGDHPLACHWSVSAVLSLGLQGLDLLNLPLSGAPALAHGRARYDQPRPSLLIRDRGNGGCTVRMAKPDYDDSWVLTTLTMVGVGLSLAAAATPRPRRRNGLTPRWCSFTVLPSRMVARWRDRGDGTAAHSSLSRVLRQSRPLRCRWSGCWC